MGKGGTMLKWMIHRKLSAFEREHGYDASYMHEVLATDLGAFLKFARATAIGTYRKDVPLDLYFAAGLTSAMHADCGLCTQLGVGFALQSGVPAPAIAAIVAGDEAAMSGEVALGVRFARAVLAHDPKADVYREEIVRRWGPRALLALAFAIMGAQLYPTLKYALGHGKACTRVVVAGQTVTPRHIAVSAVGRIAFVARAVVLAVVGYFLIEAAVHLAPRLSRGPAGALRAVREQPHGHLLLGLLAIGLMAFGAYGILEARWHRLFER
jgi:hypothetical protein